MLLTVLLTQQVCGSISNSEKPSKRTKRSPGVTSYSGHSQFTVAGVNPQFYNSPPVLSSLKNYAMFEDSGTLVVTLTATDAEGDEVFFRQDSSYSLPLGGSAELDGNGQLRYRPCENCYGSERVSVQLIEKRFDTEPALITSEIINIEVHAVNDNPVLFVSDSDYNVVIPEQFVDLVWILEQSGNYSFTNTYKTILFGGYDVDGNDLLDIAIEYPSNGTLTLYNTTQMIGYEKKLCDKEGNLVIRNYINTTKMGQQPTFNLPCEFTSNIASKQISLSAAVVHFKPFPRLFGKDQMKVNILMK